MKTISIHVSETAYREFQEMSVRTGRPVAELIRQAMAEYLQHDDTRRSLVDIQPHTSGKLLRKWKRSEIVDEMLG